MVYPYDFPGHLIKISRSSDLANRQRRFSTQLSFPSFHDFPGLPLFAHCWLRPGSFGSSDSMTLPVRHGKIHRAMTVIGKPSISMGHLYHGELLVITRGYILQRQKHLLFHIVSLFLVSDSTQIQQKNYFAWILADIDG